MASKDIKRKSQSDLHHFFGGKSKKCAEEQDEEKIIDMDINNEFANTLANNLFLSTSKRVKLTYLTKDGHSWYILVPGFLPTPDIATFNEQWDLHPTTFHELKIFGKVVKECRYSQSWGYSYAYSGSTNKARSLDESPFTKDLIAIANNSVGGNPYNFCLQVNHSIFVDANITASLYTTLFLTFSQQQIVLYNPLCLSKYFYISYVFIFHLIIELV